MCSIACDCVNQGLAGGWIAAAAVFHQKAKQALDPVEIREIADGAPLPFASDQPRAGEDRQICGHCVLSDLQRVADVARRNAFGARFDQKAKDIQSRGLAKGGKGVDGSKCIHISGSIDI